MELSEVRKVVVEDNRFVGLKSCLWSGVRFDVCGVRKVEVSDQKCGADVRRWDVFVYGIEGRLYSSWRPVRRDVEVYESKE